MLKVKKVENELGVFDFEILNNEKKLNILFGGNGDLYFYVHKNNIKDKQIVDFEITKEDYTLFSLFEKLYNEIINCDIYKLDEFESEFCESKEEIDEILNMYNDWN